MIKFFQKAQSEGRDLLYENEVYEILKSEGLDVPVFEVLGKNESENKSKLEKIPGEKIVLKIISPSITHKSDVGGVKVTNKQEALNIVKTFYEKFSDLSGVLAMEFIEHNGEALGSELMLGLRNTESFGYVVSIGPGGTDAEHLPKILKTGMGHKIASLESTNTDKEWLDVLEQSAVLDYLEGNIRGKKKLASRSECVKWLKGFSSIAKKIDALGFEIKELELNPLAASRGKLFSIDGLLRFSSKTKEYSRPGIKDNSKRAEKVKSLLNPKSVALIGVSEKAVNPGRAILINLLEQGFPKSNVFIVKPNVSEIEGCKCVSDIASIPSKVDVFVLSVDASQVPSILEDLNKHNKTNSVILISGGMAEKEGGEDIEHKVYEILHKSDFVLNGGNCLGIRSLDSKFNTFFVPSTKLPIPTEGKDNVAIISQSGAFAIVRMNRFSWMNPRYNISTGNQSDMTVGDYLEVLSDDKKVNVYGVYSEGFKPNDGKLFVKNIKKIKSLGKDIVIYKAGRTAAGRSAVQGHTASIAGDYPTTYEILSRAGAYVADNFEEFEDALMLSSFWANKKLKGNKVFAISNAGFECAGIADHLEGVELATLSEGLKSKLQEVLKKHKLDGIIGAKNPLDLTPMAGDQAILDILKVLNESQELDSVLLSLVPFTKAMQSLPKYANAGEDMMAENGLIVGLRKLSLSKPILMCVDAGSMYDPYCAEILKSDIPLFRTIDRAGYALSKFYSYRSRS